MKVCRFLLIVLLLLALILLPGCWDYAEYEDLTLIDAVGFDSGPNGEVTMTVLYSPTVSNTAGGGGGQGQGQSQQTREIQVSAPTVACGLDQLQQIIPKQLFFGNTRIIVFGNQITPKVLQKIISFLDTTQYIRPATLVAVSKGKADALLSIQETTGAEEPISERIVDLITNTIQSGATVSVSILQLLIALEREGIEPVLPLIESKTQPQSEQPTSRKNNNPGAEKPALGLVPLKPGNCRISGLAVLKGFKLVGELDESASRGLAWIHSQKFNGHLCFNYSYQDPTSGHPKPVNFRFSKIKTEIKMNISKKGPQVELKVKASGILEEFRILNGVLPPAFVKPIEQKIAAKIKQDLAKTVAKAQSLDSDILGFGFELFRQHLKDWQKTYRNEWDRTFPELPVHIQVKVSILSTGTKLPSFKER